MLVRLFQNAEVKKSAARWGGGGGKNVTLTKGPPSSREEWSWMSAVLTQPPKSVKLWTLDLHKGWPSHKILKVGTFFPNRETSVSPRFFSFLHFWFLIVQVSKECFSPNCNDLTRTERCSTNLLWYSLWYTSLGCGTVYNDVLVA